MKAVYHPVRHGPVSGHERLPGHLSPEDAHEPCRRGLAPEEAVIEGFEVEDV